MKIAAWVAVGLVIGFVLGGVAPRADRVNLERRVARLERDLARGGRGGMGLMGLDRVFARPGREESAGEDERVGEGDEQARYDNEAARAADGGVDEASAGDTPRWTLAEFDTVADAQRVRIMQSRAALEQQADLDGAQLAAVDRALATMNQQLAPYAEELIEIGLSDTQPSPRDLLTLTHDVSGILSEAQIALEDAVGAEGRARVDDSAALEVWSYIDLRALRPALESAEARRAQRAR